MTLQIDTPPSCTLPVLLWTIGRCIPREILTKKVFTHSNRSRHISSAFPFHFNFKNFFHYRFCICNDIRRRSARKNGKKWFCNGIHAGLCEAHTNTQKQHFRTVSTLECSVNIAVENSLVVRSLCIRYHCTQEPTHKVNVVKGWGVPTRREREREWRNIKQCYCQWQK